MGIGFEIDADKYKDLIVTDLGTQAQGHTSIYARVPFNVDDPASLSALTLSMKYDDGFVAYLNGTEVERTGLRQDDPTFDSTSKTRSSTSAVKFAHFNISQHMGLLKPGENILAIHALNSSATNKDLFFHCSAVTGGTFETLYEGQNVSFNEGQGDKGPRAEDVKSA